MVHKKLKVERRGQRSIFMFGILGAKISVIRQL